MVTRYKVKQCCGGSGTTIKLDIPVSNEMVKILCGFGFKEREHFTKNGILYLENSSIILNGAFGSNSIGVKCKSNNCDESLDELEKILNNIT